MLSHTFSILLLLVGAVLIFISALVVLHRLFQTRVKWEDVRDQFNRHLLLGLELIIAADIILATSVTDKMVFWRLALLVVIRSLLGITLKKEGKNGK